MLRGNAFEMTGQGGEAIGDYLFERLSPALIISGAQPNSARVIRRRLFV
jgi:hypothetical protein